MPSDRAQTGRISDAGRSTEDNRGRHFGDSDAMVKSDNATEIVVVLDDRMLSCCQVQERTGLSRTTIWRLEQTHQFPARRILAPRRVGWLASEIDHWIAHRCLIRKHPSAGIPDWLTRQ